MCAKMTIRGNKRIPAILPVDKSYLKISDPYGLSVIVSISEEFRTCEDDKIAPPPSCLVERPKVLTTGLLMECLQAMYNGRGSADT